MPFHLSVFLPGVIISLLLNFNSLSLIYILSGLWSLNQQSAAFNAGPGVKEFTPINRISAIIPEMLLVLYRPRGWALPQLLGAGFGWMRNIQVLVPTDLGSALQILPLDQTLAEDALCFSWGGSVGKVRFELGPPQEWALNTFSSKMYKNQPQLVWNGGGGGAPWHQARAFQGNKLMAEYPRGTDIWSALFSLK